ncbi:NADH-quinone oxidoreductase subunit NuoN [Rhodanobacter sp. DHB23]|uniref:NADH-quinone oxidoreductase subunit NuoN n=1 Tax=Rhodanobacter sp. DHB23 TaxID=2775923 RepID=UPI001785E52B|nr:NADH-quinone oxidoreductase subunit NuoN [Rhodanobacter sp. DHB23]MBD8873965.1 NADH-quinone oxidoreductase subunit NuoN [Rhodanobacter sp. DHB23]
MPTLNDILVLLPEFYLVAVACLLLLLDAFMKPEQRGTLHWISVVVLLVATYLVVAGQPDVTVTAFGGMFVRDQVSEILKVFALLSTVLVFIYARPYLVERKQFIGEFYTLMIFAVIGVMLLVSAGNLIMVYLGLELLTLSSYALVALNRDSSLSSEAAIKYFVLGALSSGMLLYGMSMVYGATGSLDLVQLHTVVTQSAMPHLLVFGLIFMLVGIAFKLGAAPFHMWIPDVYQGASTPVTTFIASTSKLAAFGMAWRLLETGLGGLSQHWQPMLAAVAVLSMAIGNLVAIVQTNLKRMLAYSTISHMGYLLVGLVNAGPEGYSSAMFYAISYALMSTVSFGVILALSRAGFECEEISDLKGLNQRSPWFAALMALALFSLAGVPPLFGFYAKYLVLQAAIDAHMLWLAIVGAVFAIIGLYYYLHVVKVMYFDKPEEGGADQPQADASLRVVLSINGLALLVLGVYWGPLLGWCRHSFGLG